MSFAAAHILDHLNTINPVFVDGKLSPLRTGAELATVMRIGGPKFDIPAAMQRKCYDETREDVAWLNETFGTQLFNEPFSQTNRDVMRASAFVDALHKVADVVAEQLRVITAMKVCNEGIKAIARRDFDMADALLDQAARLAPHSRYVSEFRLRLGSARQKAQNPE